MNDRIIGRIKKMLTLANDAGATEGERDNAMRMALATLAKYNLDIATVEGETRSADEARIAHDVAYHGVVWARHISQSVARLFFCEYFYVKISANTDNCNHYFVGRQSNCVTASYIARFVVESVHKEGKENTRGLHYSAYRAFGLGAATKISERCRALRAAQEKATAEATAESVGESPLAAPVVGTSLVLATFYETEKAANEAFLKQSGTKVRPGSSGHKVYDHGAFAAGKAHGARVSLSPQIGGSKQKQLS